MVFDECNKEKKKETEKEQEVESKGKGVFAGWPEQKPRALSSFPADLT